MEINDYDWLFDTIAVSGSEETLGKAIFDWLKNNTDWNVDVDDFGNIVVSTNNSQIDDLIVFCAHMDEVGVMLQKREGLNWRFIVFGSIDASLLVGNEIKVKERTGRVVIKDKSTKEIGKYEYDKLFIAFSAEDSEALSVGDIGSFNTFLRVEQKRIIGKALDNRIGCMILLDILKETPVGSISKNLTFVFTREEEIGGRGIQYYSYNNRISKLVCIDATSLSDDNNIIAGGGPCLTYADGSSQGDIGIIKDMEYLAVRNGILYQRAVNSFGFTESAFPPIISAAKTLTISYPVDYIHRNVSSSIISDLQKTKKLLSYYINFIGRLK
jgi:endoglucanase